jgi:oxygen-independent coproporphyrinogen-3 oxidase
MSQAGIYLHIPFCRSRCSYCDFAVSIYQADLAVKYVDALCQEIQSSKLKVQSSKIAVDTIYFGGGTPSLLFPNQIERILKTVYENFSVASTAEITMEMNPATLTLAKARNFRSLGINRASFGAQTFDDNELKKLGRRHSADDVRRTIDLLHESDFQNVSFDLIAGLPGQILPDWEQNLDEALKLEPKHLSLYMLEIHEGTPLARHIREGKQPQPDEDLSTEMYELMVAKTSDAGYEQYEISNFCLPSFESKHNSKYWTFDAVYGFGCSAHSFDGKGTRWSNERDTHRYIQMIETVKTAIVEQDEINVASEFAFLGLRMMRGIDLLEYKKRFGIDLLEQHATDLERFFDAELLQINGDNLRLTTKGALFSNEVFAVFV